MSPKIRVEKKEVVLVYIDEDQEYPSYFQTVAEATQYIHECKLVFEASRLTDESRPFDRDIDTSEIWAAIHDHTKEFRYKSYHVNYDCNDIDSTEGHDRLIALSDYLVILQEFSAKYPNAYLPLYGLNPSIYNMKDTNANLSA